MALEIGKEKTFMEKVSVEIYPPNSSWDEKVFSMPNIPRGDIGLTCVLQKILEKVENGDSPAQIVKFEGSDSNTTLNELCVRLRPMKSYDIYSFQGGHILPPDFVKDQLYPFFLNALSYE